MLLEFKMNSIEVLNKWRNELLKREEILVEISFEKTPSFEEVKKMIAEKFSKPEEVIEVRYVKGSFGTRKFKSEVFVYDSEEELKKNIVKTRKQRIEEKKAAHESRVKAFEEAKKGEEKEEKKESEEKTETQE